jgi:hypothetical protein
MPRPQFRLRSLFILTAVVAVGCLVGAPVVWEHGLSGAFGVVVLVGPVLMLVFVIAHGKDRPKS